MNTKQKKILADLYWNPVKNNIKWTDVESLISSLQGRVIQGNGSRVRIILGEQSLNIHTPHPQKELKPYQIRAIRRLFLEQGIKI